jgi:hypothetical protein
MYRLLEPQISHEEMQSGTWACDDQVLGLGIATTPQVMQEEHQYHSFE